MPIFRLGRHRVAPHRFARAGIAAVLAASSLAGTTLAGTTAAGAVTSTPRLAPPSITMGCSPGQFDINTTKPAAVAAATGVTADVAKRWVAQGPWWRPSDLLAVQGIGSGWLKPQLSAGKLCASLPSTPPPATAPCTGSKVDLDTAPAATLKSAFGLNTSTAANVVAARPYLRLSQINPDRVPGLGTSSQNAVLKNGCLTPPTITTSTATWMWAYSDTTTVDTRGLDALSVPAGTITTSPGAWLSVTDVTTSPTELDGPTADFHIWGTWADGVKTVGVTLPDSPLGFDDPTGAWTPVIVHLAATGDPQIFGGPLLATNTVAGTVTAQETSLSTSQMAYLPTNIYTVTLTDTFPAPPTRQTVLNAMIRAFTGTRADQPSCAPNITHEDLVHTSGDAITTNLVIHDVPLKYCVQQANGLWGDWTFANNTGAVLKFDGLAQGSARVTSTGPSGDIITDAYYSAYNSVTNTSADIPPGGSVTIESPQGDSNTISVSPDDALLAPTFLMTEADHFAADDIADLYDLVNKCGWSLQASQSSAVSRMLCIKNLAEQLVTTGGTKSAARWVKAFEAVMFAVHGVVSLTDDLALHLEESSLTLGYDFPLPPPTGQSGGSGTPPPAGTDQPIIVKIANSTASYVLHSDNTANPIPDGGTYICEAQSYPVKYNVAQTDFTNEVTSMGPDARCTWPATPRSQWFYPSNLQLPVLLRQADGATYYVDTNGLRTPLFSNDGSIFSCMTSKYRVWDYVTGSVTNGVATGELSHFPSSGVVAIGC